MCGGSDCYSARHVCEACGKNEGIRLDAIPVLELCGADAMLRCRDCIDAGRIPTWAQKTLSELFAGCPHLPDPYEVHANWRDHMPRETEKIHARS